jgi:hypothetical protein
LLKAPKGFLLATRLFSYSLYRRASIRKGKILDFGFQPPNTGVVEELPKVMFDAGVANSVAGGLVVPGILGVPVLGAAAGLAAGNGYAFFAPKIPSGGTNGFATFPPATVESPTPEDDPKYWREVAEANGVTFLTSPSSSSLELSSSTGSCRTGTRTHNSISLMNTTRRVKANLDHFSSHP